MAKTLQELRTEKNIIESRINRLNGSANDRHLNEVGRVFHLGMVGGSGRNTARLNQRRAANLDKTISNAVEVCRLDKELKEVERKIYDLENDTAGKRARKEAERDILRAQYWQQLKPGDNIDIGNGPTLISKKSKKSLYTGSGCKWTAADIIGKSAAALL